MLLPAIVVPPFEADDPELPFVTFPLIDLLVPLRDTKGDRCGLFVPLCKLLGPFDYEVLEVWLLFSFAS